jgi:gliding motility-associated-like protein
MKELKRVAGWVLVLCLWCTARVSPAQVVINELDFRQNGSGCEQVLSSPFQQACGSQAVELHNPSFCAAMDVSCWLLATPTGTLRLPTGTVVPPRGFVVIGGVAVFSADVTPGDAGVGGLCPVDQAYSLPVSGSGFVALLRPDGSVADAVYWGANPQVLLNDLLFQKPVCLPVPCVAGGAAPGLPIFFSPMTYVGPPTALNVGQSLGRLPDAGPNWVGIVPTLGTCNTPNVACPPPVALPQVTAGPDGRVCLGESVTLAGFAPPGYTVQWVGASAALLSATNTFTPQATPEQTTTFYLEATGGPNGCTYRDSVVVVVDEPVVGSFSVPATVCAGQWLELEAQPNDVFGNLTYQWHFGPLAVSEQLDVFGAQYRVRWPNAAAGTQTISLVLGRGVCETTITRTLTVLAAPQVDAGSPAQICTGESLTLTATAQNLPPGCTFEWVAHPSLSGLNTPTPVASPSQTTTYYVRLACVPCGSVLDSVTVTVVPRPAFTLDAPVTRFCAGSSGIPVTVNGFGGTPPYVAVWQPQTGISGVGGLGITAQPATTTAYTVQLVDANGCAAPPQTLTVRVEPLPVAQAGPDVVICGTENNGVFLQGFEASGTVGSYAYSWSPAGSLNDPSLPTPYARPDTSTIYQLTITNLETGCSSVATGLDELSTVRVEVLEVPAARAYSRDTVYICSGESIQLGDAGGTGGGPTYTYEWSPTTGLNNPFDPRPTATPATTTTYQLKTLSNGCRSVGQLVTVVVRPAPLIVTGSETSICPGDSTQLTSLVGGAAEPWSFRWVPADGLSDPRAANPKASPTQTTTYTLEVLAAGCAGPLGRTQRVVVRPVAVASVLDSVVYWCPDDGPAGVRLPGVVNTNGQAPVFISWAPALGLSDSTVLQPQASPRETTVYTLTARVGLCTTTATVRVVVWPALRLRVVPDSGAVCAGSAVRLEASGGAGSARFLWEWPDGTGTLRQATGRELIDQPSTTTTYTLTATEGGCTATATTRLTVLAGVEAAFDHSAARGCTGLRVSFQARATGPVQGYVWNFGDGTPAVNTPNPTHAFVRGGSYDVTLTVVSANGCSSSLTQTLANISDAGQPRLLPEPPVSLIPPADTLVLVLPEASLTLRLTEPLANPVWIWGDSTQTLETALTAVHRYRVPGTYQPAVEATEANGCSVGVLGPVVRVVLPELVIPTVFTPNNDGINDTWQPVYNGTRRLAFQVFDRLGIRLFDSTQTSGGWDGTRAGNPLPEGVYYYRATLDERTYAGALTLVR